MALDPSYTLTMSYKDRSGESTSWSVPTDATHAAAGDGDTDFTALETATNALIDGVLVRENWTQTHRTGNLKHSAAGQREQKYLVTYEDIVTLVPYSFELPCRKVSIDPPVNTDEYDISVSPFAAYKTALEAYAVSPDGNGIRLISVRLIGKNT